MKLTAIIKTALVIAIHLGMSISLQAAILNETGLVNTGDGDSGWKIFPATRLSVDPYYIRSGNSDYTAMITALAEFDYLRYGLYTFTFSMEQITGFDKRGNENFSFDEIRYNLDYLRISREFTHGYLSLFIDHRCVNFINMHADDEQLVRWYGLGLRWETRGMRTGEKGKRKGFRLPVIDSYINFSTAFRKSIGTLNYPAMWTSDITLRDDLYITESISLYLSGYAEYFQSGRFSWNRSVEAGTRFSFEKIEISPYIKYDYRSDTATFTVNGSPRSGAGIRFESALNDTDNIASSTSKQNQFSSPELHMSGLYGKYIADDKKNYSAEATFMSDIVKYGVLSLFLSYSLRHSSLLKDAGMYPAYINSYCEGGVSFTIPGGVYVAPLYRYHEYDEGNDRRTGSFDYRLAAVRISTAAIRPGYLNSRLKSIQPNGSSFINNLEFEITCGLIHGSDGIDARYIVDSSVRWDIASFINRIFYLSAGERWLHGGESSLTFITECGVRSNGSISVMLFLRNEYNHRGERAEDIAQSYNICGVRFNL